MKFSSNAELARHLIQKIMLDGEVHSKTDITDYVITQSKKYELKVPMTNYIIYGVMNKMFYSDPSPYTIVKRGHYKLDDAQLNKATSYQKAHKILENAREQVRSCFVVTLTDSDLDVDALKSVIQRAKTMDKLLEHAMKEAEKGQQEIGEQETKETEQQELEGGMQMKL